MFLVEYIEIEFIVMKNYYQPLSIFLFLLGFVFTAQSQTDTTDSAYDYVTPEVKTYSVKCITAPDGFEISEKFNGYINKTSSSTILVSVIDGINYINLQQSITPEHWKTQKVVEVSNEPFSTDSGLSGILYKLSFTVDGIEMFRYMLITGDLTKTLWINATYPAQFDPLLGPTILNSYKSVRLID